MLKKWKTLSSRIIHQNPWWTYKLDEFEIPDSIRGEYHHVFTHGSSMIVPVRDDGSIIMVKQYRYLGDQDSIEFPCGSVKPGSDHRATAVAELAEEAGVAAGTLQLAGAFNPYNGVTSEMCRVYLASDLRPAHAESDATEACVQFYLSPNEVDERIRSGEIWDGMSMAAWVLAKSELK